MTPEVVSSTILAALTIAEKAGVTELTKKAVTDAYDSLKSVIHAKFGGNSEPAQALAKLEANPASPGRKATLTEELGTVDLTDPGFAAAAQSLLNLVNALPKGEQHIQSARGTDIAQADRGGTATVTHYAPPSRHD